MMEKLIFYLQYPFVRYALIVGVLIALCSALLGIPLVLRRFSLIGDGLAHVAFAAMAVAAVLKLDNDMPVILVITIVSAVLILGTGRSARIKGDSAIAMISVGSMAVGYLLVNVFSTSANISGDVCSTLFGSTSILTLSESDVRICCMLSAAVVFAYIMLHNRIFAVTFDESFAAATGLNTRIYNLVIAVICAVVIVLAMNLVGSLLITALVVFPALSAMRLFSDYRSVTLFAAFLSVICARGGMLVSILAGTPIGSTIVIADMAAFLVCALIGRMKGET
ncbi:MAG: metal ABC transporter permease [Eubacteriaceae bacterium]|nr:metal ABC transporter permease [Eubacteriaceae bacterium]